MQLTVIQKKIYELRGHKIMLDRDLALLYDVPTKSLNLAVKRNKERFPPDFMFQLTKKELENLRFQIETSSHGGIRYLPYAFTELGVSMLSSVLGSRRAIRMNISIMRAFVALKQLVLDYKYLEEKIKEIRQSVTDHDEQIKKINKVIEILLRKKIKEETWKENRERIGFKR